MEWVLLVSVGIGFFVLIMWVNLYAASDDTPDPTGPSISSTPPGPGDGTSTSQVAEPPSSRTP